MKLTWYGHSCFLLETAEGSVVFDPYAPGSVPGVELPRGLTADAVHCSHGHKDHGYAAGVTLSGREPGFRVKRVDCWHDDRQGALRGRNTIWIVEAEGRRIAHLGDLGHELSPAQLTALGRVDLLLIPVGGHYTIDAATADRVSRKIAAALTVPMHYRGPGFGFKVIGPVDDFLALCDEVVRLDSSEMDPELIRGPVTVVLKCPVT